MPNVSVFLDDVDRILEAKGESAAALKPDYLPIKQTPWWVSMLPTLLFIGAMVVFWFFMMRQNGGAGSAVAAPMAAKVLGACAQVLAAE